MAYWTVLALDLCDLRDIFFVMVDALQRNFNYVLSGKEKKQGVLMFTSALGRLIIGPKQIMV